MNDLISRQDAINALGDEPLVWFEEDGYELGLNDQWHYDVNALKALPSVESKTGKWIKVYGFATPGGDPVWRCSECGKGLHIYGIEASTYGADIAEHQWVSCPNCGADMRPREEEQE